LRQRRTLGCGENIVVHGEHEVHGLEVFHESVSGLEMTDAFVGGTHDMLQKSAEK
jgi:hypothetical protein